MWVWGLVAFIAIVLIGRAMQGSAEVSAHKKAIAKIDNFKPVVSRPANRLGPGVAIDPSSNRFAFTARGNVKVFGFSDLIAVEVMRNGSSISVTNRGSQVAGAAVGALLLGPVGLLLGGVTGSKRSVEKIQRLSLKVFTNDLVMPVYEIVFFDDKPADPKSAIVKAASDELDAWHGRFQTILHGARAGVPVIAEA
ncbi:hypothetical protein G6K83_11280 [Agrobacterium rhizogenes]|uniref:hypothetical protein n=1 Tax=Rhizobium rhizogenes TaxID=359 RepID=UPI0015748DC8|nr:hypothetical protein [Rhizobium rhizogenes]NTH25654.1 hypothetical protein [Rhizobium rhizogenes]